MLVGNLPNVCMCRETVCISGVCGLSSGMLCARVDNCAMLSSGQPEVTICICWLQGSLGHSSVTSCPPG